LISAIIAESDTSQHSLFAEGSIMVVHKQQTRSGIARDKYICPAILVEICGNDRHTVAFRRTSNPGLLAYIGKGAVAVIAVKRMPSSGRPRGPHSTGTPFQLQSVLSPGTGACSSEKRT
jgi:hypothetical protein